MADASTIQFGNDQEIKLTHVADTGLLLTDSGGGPTLQFHDANEAISSDGGHLIFTSNGVTFDFPSADGSDGQVLKTNGSGVLSFVTASANTPSSADGQALGSASLEWSDLFLADGGTIQFGNDQDTILTHTDGSGLTLNSTNKLMFNDASQFIQGASATVLDIAATDEIELTATLIEVVGNATVSGTLGVTGIATFTDDIIIGDGKTIGSASDVDAIAIGSDGDVTLTQDLELQHDGAILSFGANDEIALTHVHDTGLLLTDSGGSPTLQFHDSNESVMSDGSNLKLTSGGTAFTVPASDGSNGQFLKTNGSGVLSFGTVSTTGAFTAFEYTATAAQTSFSGSDDNSNTLAYTAGVSNVFVTVNGVMLDGSDYTATNGTAVVLSAAAAANDIVKILATNASSITTADLDGAEFVLDADGDTSIRANTDDQIDFKLGNAIDITMGVNAMNILSGTTLTIDSGATITNSGTANGFGLSTGKAIVLAMLFGR